MGASNLRAVASSYAQQLKKLQGDAKREVRGTLKQLAAAVGYKNETSLANSTKPNKISPEKLVALCRTANWDEHQITEIVLAHMTYEAEKKPSSRAAWRLIQDAKKTMTPSEQRAYDRKIAEIFLHEVEGG